MKGLWRFDRNASKPLFSLLAAKAAIVNQLHGLSVCFASFNMVTPLREHFLMFPRFGNALDILSEYCEERYEEALAAYRQASECSASEPSSYEKQAQVLEKWASKLRKRAMGLRSWVSNGSLPNNFLELSERNGSLNLTHILAIFFFWRISPRFGELMSQTTMWVIHTGGDACVVWGGEVSEKP